MPVLSAVHGIEKRLLVTTYILEGHSSNNKGNTESRFHMTVDSINSLGLHLKLDLYSSYLCWNNSSLKQVCNHLWFSYGEYGI